MMQFSSLWERYRSYLERTEPWQGTKEYHGCFSVQTLIITVETNAKEMGGDEGRI